MSDIGELAVRMVVSLGVVLVIVAIAYFVARRRQQGLTMVGPARRRPRAVTAAPSITVEGRAGLARGSAAVAVRFADRIVLVGVTDGAPAAVLAEVSAEVWDDDSETLADVEPVRTPLTIAAQQNGRVSFLDALRDATSRSA